MILNSVANFTARMSANYCTMRENLYSYDDRALKRLVIATGFDQNTQIMCNNKANTCAIRACA